ncbi:MAG: hypothetical protein ACLPX1_11710 [Steroidobacteraceae bacterium]
MIQNSYFVGLNAYRDRAESLADDAGFCVLKDRNRHEYQAHPGQKG